MPLYNPNFTSFGGPDFRFARGSPQISRSANAVTEHVAGDFHVRDADGLGVVSIRGTIWIQRLPEADDMFSWLLTLVGTTGLLTLDDGREVADAYLKSVTETQHPPQFIEDGVTKAFHALDCEWEADEWPA
jgi:hypothetical protein